MLEELLKLWADRETLREIASKNPYLGALIYVFLQAGQIVLAPLPGEAGFVAGFIFGAKVGFLLHIIGAALGSTIAFFLTKLFRKKYASKLKGHPLEKKLKGFLKKGGILGLFFAYLIPGFPKDVLNYLLGLLNISYRSFITANLLGRAPTSFLMALQGDLVYQGNPKKIIVVLTFTIFVVGLMILLRKRLEENLFENSS